MFVCIKPFHSVQQVANRLGSYHSYAWNKTDVFKMLSHLQQKSKGRQSMRKGKNMVSRLKDVMSSTGSGGCSVLITTCMLLTKLSWTFHWWTLTVWPLFSENTDFLRSQNLIYEKAEDSQLYQESATDLLWLLEARSTKYSEMCHV